MAKFFKTSEDIANMIQDIFEDTSLPQMGVELKVISTTKAKNALKASKASATVHYLTNNDAVLIVYEDALDRLSDEYKVKLIEGALSNISYDTDKDKVAVESDIAKEMFRMRKKYENYVDILETSYIIIDEIEEEEKQRKEEEKIRKAEERAAKKRNNG
jgi:hypothetical protein